MFANLFIITTYYTKISIYFLMWYRNDSFSTLAGGSNNQYTLAFHHALRILHTIGRFWDRINQQNLTIRIFRIFESTFNNLI